MVMYFFCTQCLCSVWAMVDPGYDLYSCMYLLLVQSANGDNTGVLWFQKKKSLKV